jgi:predicted DNA-binding protein with PD1-like motif
MVASATHKRRAGAHHRAREHHLSLDFGVEPEQRPMSGHLRESEVDQIAEIV